MDNNYNHNKVLKPLPIMVCGVLGVWAKKHSPSENTTCHYKVSLRHPEVQTVPCGHPDMYGSPSACQRLKQESKKHSYCHSELRYLAITFKRFY